jgi:hypothetical protein
VVVSDTDSTDDEALPSTPHHKNMFKTPVRTALQSLCTSSLSYLIMSSPIQSTVDPPSFTPCTISPPVARHLNLLGTIPETALESELQEELAKAKAKLDVQKTHLIALQSSLVLNGIYIEDVRGQLAAQEEAQKNKQKKGRLVADGRPRLYTAKEFMQQVKTHTEETIQKEAEAKLRKEQRATKAITAEGQKIAEAEQVSQKKVI